MRVVVQAAAGPNYDTGCMVAVVPPPSVAKATLARLGDATPGLPADELHMTLFYLGKLDGPDAPTGTPEMYAQAIQTAMVQGPIHVELTHHDVMGDETPDGRACVFTGANPQLVAAREQIRAAFDAASLSYSDRYAFRPHMTVGYYQADGSPVPVDGPLVGPGQTNELVWDASSVRLVWGMEVYDLDLAPAALVAVVRAALPATQVCKYCDEQATQRFLWAEGMAYIPVCDAHAAKARTVIEDDNHDEVIDIWPVAASVRLAMADPAPHIVEGSLVPIAPVPYAWFDPDIALAKIRPGMKMAVDVGGSMPGHVYGVVGPRGVCIRDGKPGCWTVDDLEREDPDFTVGQPHQGDTEVVYPDGSVSMLATANMGGDRGHSPDESWMKTSTVQDFYENSSTQLARLRYFWGPPGLCAAGVMWPDVAADARAVAKFRASPVSLHARPIKDQGGRLGMVGACLVNVPGLPNARAASTVDAGGIVMTWDGDNLSVQASVTAAPLHVSQERRDEAAESGHALADGSYPISSADQLRRAISSIGRGGKKGTSRYRRIKRHIIKRARDLDKVDMLPDSWGVTASVDESVTAAMDFKMKALRPGVEVVDDSGTTWFVQSDKPVVMPDGQQGVLVSPVLDPDPLDSELMHVVDAGLVYPVGSSDGPDDDAMDEDDRLTLELHDIDLTAPGNSNVYVVTSAACCDTCAKREKRGKVLPCPCLSKTAVADDDAALAALDAELADMTATLDTDAEVADLDATLALLGAACDCGPLAVMGADWKKKRKKHAYA